MANEIKFSKEKPQNSNNYFKQFSTFLFIEKVKITTDLKYHFTLVRITIIKASDK